jgi:cullin-4
MSGHRVQDLVRMYSLLARVGSTEALRDEWRQYIVSTGTAIVKDEANVCVELGLVVFDGLGL